jgi:hypothetical protein
MRSLLLLFLGFLAFSIQAQISTLPYSQSFTSSFVEGDDVSFLPNILGNEVASSNRIFRDDLDFNSAPAAMAIVPTSSFNGEVIISLNLTDYSSVKMSFVAKSMLNGTGDRSAILTMTTSVDGGTTWINAQEIGSFPNENQAIFESYSYTLPPESFNFNNVKVRMRVTRSGGDGTTAKLVIDDLTIEEALTPSINTNTSDLGLFLQILNYPSDAKQFSVDGLNLSSNLVITAPTGYQVSLNPNDGFAGSLSITPVSGAVSATDVFVRLNRGMLGDISGIVVISSTGVSSSFVSVSGLTTSPSNPSSPFDMSSGNSYSFTNWSPSSTAGTYPPNMSIWTKDINDSDIDDFFSSNWICVYNLATRSRVLGLGQDGIGFINTGSSQRSGDCDESSPGEGEDIPNARPGALVLSLNTTNRQNVKVSWVGKTIEANTREYAIHMQYRVGNGENNPNVGWLDFSTPVEYNRQSNNGDTLFMAPVTLPSTCNDQSLVQLRWVYYFKQGNSVNRPLLAVDNIRVTSDEIGLASLNVSPSSLTPFDQVVGSPSPEKQVTVEGVNLIADITITAPENYEISTTSGIGFQSEITLPQVGGMVSATSIYIRLNAVLVGSHSGDIQFESVGADGPLSVLLSVAGETIESSTIPLLYINEILASNSTVFADEFDEFDDWIEIYNPNDFAVDLAGMYISDDLDNITRYQFPSGSATTIIPPKGYILIWADNQSEQGPLHTNFAVSASGENIILTFTDGFTIMDSISFGAQLQNISYGREEDGGIPWVSFNNPTPNASNNNVNSVPLIANKPPFNAYPNPVSNRLFFSEPLVFVIFNINGQEVVRVKAPVQTLEVEYLQNGVYFIQSESGQVVKFIKQ